MFSVFINYFRAYKNYNPTSDTCNIKIKLCKLFSPHNFIFTKELFYFEEHK